MRFERVLILAPHPDDDVIAAGGLIQHVLSTGGEVHIVFVTDGERNPWPQRWTHKKWSITAEDRAAWGAMRRDEADCSLTRLGVPTSASTFLGFPDSGLKQGDVRLIQAIRDAIVAFGPSQIVSPSTFDLHLDHRTIASAAHIASAGEIPINTYVVHGSPNERRFATRIELTEIEQKCKRAAIECHRSQLLLSRDRFLAHARSAEVFYLSEYDRLGAESKTRRGVTKLRHAIQVIFGGGGYPEPQPSRVQPAADVQDRPGDVPSLL